MSNSHLFTHDNDRNFLNPPGMFEHLFKVFLIRFYVNVLGLFPIRRPGVGRIGSTRLSINDDLFRHNEDLLYWIHLLKS